MRLLFIGFFLSASLLLIAADPEFQLNTEESKPLSEETKPLETEVVHPEEPPVVTEVPSAPTESQLAISPPNLWRGGFQLGGLGALSTVDYAAGYSGGLGWALALNIERRFNPTLRAVGSFGYQSLSMGRFVGSSGGLIVDPSAEFIQSQKGPFVQGMFGISFMNGTFDFGLEYFHPTTAQQTGPNSTYDFNPSKFLFVVAGPSYSMKIRGDWEMEGHAWFFVNTLGTSQFKFMGCRLELALRTPL